MKKGYKSGFVTLIGRLIGQKIAITSEKPQTTRNRIQTVYTDEHGQIIFLDTPGIHKAKNKLGEYMVNVAEHTLREVDVILWLVEPGTYIGSGEQHILKVLQTVKTPVILVINKIDTVKKEDILKTIETYKDAYHFKEVIPVSAMKKTNTDTLIHTIFQYLPEGPQYYDEDTVTDQPMRQIAAEVLSAKEELAGEKVSLEEKKTELASAQETLTAKRADSDELLQELVSDADLLRETNETYEAMLEDLTEQIAEKEKEIMTV